MSVIDTYKNDDVARPTIELYEKSESEDGLKQYYKIKFREILDLKLCVIILFILQMQLKELIIVMQMVSLV